MCPVYKGYNYLSKGVIKLIKTISGPSDYTVSYSTRISNAMGGKCGNNNFLFAKFLFGTRLQCCLLYTALS